MKKLISIFTFLLFTMFAMAQDAPQGLKAPMADTVIVDTLVADTATQIVILPPVGAPTVEWLFDAKTGIFSLGLLLLMYISSFIPGLGKIDDKRKRALVVGLILGLALVIWRIFDKELTIGNFIGMAIAFISTQVTYAYGLAPAGLTTPNKPKT